MKKIPMIQHQILFEDVAYNSDGTFGTVPPFDIPPLKGEFYFSCASPISEASTVYLHLAKEKGPLQFNFVPPVSAEVSLGTGITEVQGKLTSKISWTTNGVPQ